MRLSGLVAAFALLAPLAAQDDPFFPQPAYFRKHFSNTPTHVELQPPVKLNDFVIGGTMQLSLRNYLELVMANNPDIAVQKLMVAFNRDAITRAFAPFDPVATASFSATRSILETGSLLQGASTLNTLTQPFALGYQQTFETGTQLAITYNDFKTSSNSSFSTFNPELSSSINFSVTQPLLRGRGVYINMLPVTIARSRLRAADYGFQDQLIQLVSAAESAFWDVVAARENLRVQQESYKLADAALARAQKELDLGATSPLEIYQPQANRASAELQVSLAQYQLAQVEDALRRQMGADLDPKFREIPIVLTATLEPPPNSEKVDPQEALANALRMRPDLKNVVQTMDADDLSIKQTNDNLRPNLALTAQYGSSGLGGINYPLTNIANPTVPVVPVPGGIGEALAGTFGFSNPTYGMGLTLTLPIKDRQTAANLADGLVQKKIDAYRKRSTEENIRLQVLTAVQSLNSAKEGIRIGTIARDLARKRVEADQKRYELGATTLYFVLSSQTDFITAESNLVSQIINYRRSELTLLQRTGQLLEERGIVLEP
ncbi:MAG TPA: TolC family protein [Bryobacteraceae bacterium]|jgi:outer membrane protein TolC|nr:TolC family protein [Bryobacteraceae bacterium]